MCIHLRIKGFYYVITYVFYFIAASAIPGNFRFEHLWKLSQFFLKAVVLNIYTFSLEDHFNFLMAKTILPGGESNPGLLRDRQGYLPLYYRGLVIIPSDILSVPTFPMYI